MNKKRKYEIIIMILIAVVVCNFFVIFSSTTSQQENEYNVTQIGNNTNGTVYKIIAGNTSSNESIGLILGVHSREHEIHEAVNQTIHNITSENGTKNLTNKYVIYYIKLKSNLTSREETRPAGENLANQFVVKDIKSENPFLVIDIHEINPSYEYSNFIFSLSNRTDKINSYLSNITNDVGLVDYTFNEGTSPQKVTVPIANQGINTLLMEVPIDDSINEKQQTAKKLIECLDKLKA